MKTNLTSKKSDRVFKVWEYQISHGQLLDSGVQKRLATGTSPEFPNQR